MRSQQDEAEALEEERRKQKARAMYRVETTLQVQELKKWLKQPGAQKRRRSQVGIGCHRSSFLADHRGFLDRKEDEDRAKKVPLSV